jgi:hypothetical protein
LESELGEGVRFVIGALEEDPSPTRRKTSGGVSFAASAMT